MTDEQLQLLAELAISNEVRIDKLSELFYTRLEADLAAGLFPASANLLRSEIEQESGRFADAAKRRANLRRIFGLPETDPVDAV